MPRLVGTEGVRAPTGLFMSSQAFAVRKSVYHYLRIFAVVSL